MRAHAHTLSDFLVPILSIECEPCGRRGRYNVAKLIEKYGDMKLSELGQLLANCPKAKSFSIHDRCRVRYARTAGSRDREMAGVIGDRHSPPVGFSRLGLFARGPWRP
jgi:hypothetical protein